MKKVPVVPYVFRQLSNLNQIIPNRGTSFGRIKLNSIYCTKGMCFAKIQCPLQPVSKNPLHTMWNRLKNETYKLYSYLVYKEEAEMRK